MTDNWYFFNVIFVLIMTNDSTLINISVYIITFRPRSRYHDIIFSEKYM